MCLKYVALLFLSVTYKKLKKLPQSYICLDITYTSFLLFLILGYNVFTSDIDFWILFQKGFLKQKCNYKFWNKNRITITKKNTFRSVPYCAALR